MEPPPPTSFDLERDWPAVSARVSAKLAAYKVPVALRDDLVQETGLRLLELGDKLDPSRSIVALASAIAMNLLRDHLRRERRLAPILDVDAVLDSADVESEVIARDEWRRVSAAIDRLGPEQRAALLAEIGAALAPAGRSTTAVRMLRMRGRKQLHALLDEISRARAVMGMTFKDACDRVAARLTRVTPSLRGEEVAQAGGAAIVLFAASMLVLQPEVPPAARPPAEAWRRPWSDAVIGGPTGIESMWAEHRQLIAAMTDDAVHGARGERLEAQKRSLRKPVHRLDLGPLGHAEGEDDEVVGIAAKVVGQAAAVGDQAEAQPHTPRASLRKASKLVKTIRPR